MSERTLAILIAWSITAPLIACVIIIATVLGTGAQW